MKLSLAFLFAALLAPLLSDARVQEPAQPGFDHEHRLWSKVLAEFTSGDRVDYLELSRNRAELDRYLLGLTAVDAVEFGAWTKEQRCAFWINAYNAFTVQAALANYPLEGPAETASLRDVGGKASGKVWRERNLRLGRLIPGEDSQDVSLDEIVERALRPQFKDARVHAALTNGCLGSPALRRDAFSAVELDRQLTAAARAWIADPLRTRFSKQERVVEASIVFTACREDFVREAGSVEAWIMRHAPLEERTRLGPEGELEYRPLAYDWRLNDVEREAK
jgi:hypothetical protein